MTNVSEKIHIKYIDSNSLFSFSLPIKRRTLKALQRLNYSSKVKLQITRTNKIIKEYTVFITLLLK